MKVVRIGVAGLGYMGQTHAKIFSEGKVARATLAAVWSSNPDKFATFAPARAFAKAEEMIDSGEIDAIVIATPHLSHMELGVRALEAGLHVMVEKPISAHKADAERLLAAHTDARQVFAAMFN